MQCLPKDDTAVVYYSGRGIQLQNENYLVPVDFDAKNAIDAKYASYSVARLIERIEAADVRLCVLILDASPQDSFAGGESEKREPCRDDGLALRRLLRCLPHLERSRWIFLIPETAFSQDFFLTLCWFQT